MESREQLAELAGRIHTQINEGKIPELDMPTRTKSNIEFSQEKQAWVYGDRKTKRSGKKLSGAEKLLKTAYTLEFLDDQISDDQTSTLRELYYLSESWDFDPAQFNDQDESNVLIEDLEILADVTREELGMYPEESGATLVGPIEIEEQTRRGSREIHCQLDVGEGGYQIPNNPDQINFLDHEADFMICVETGGMRDRLVQNGFDEDWNAVIVHLKGQPARATRRLIKRMNEELGIPPVVFCDGDPWSYRIFSSIAYGSIRSAHLADKLVTPDARYLGVEPSDIVDYDLPTDPLSEQDIQALESELEDPRFQTDYWEEEIELQLEIGQKSEQQSLAKHGLSFVTDTYLPEKLDELGF